MPPSLPLRSLPQSQQDALLRLHLVFTGETHRLLTDYSLEVSKGLEQAGDEQGKLTVEQWLAQTGTALRRWRETYSDWVSLLGKAIHQAALLPFGITALYHRYYFGQARDLSPFIVSPVAPTRDLLKASRDGLVARTLGEQGVNSALIQRLVAIEREGRNTIEQAMQGAMAGSATAEETGEKLAALVGAGTACHDWAIAQLGDADLEARLGDSPCRSRGLAYKMVRLGVSEAQTAHHEINTALLALAPWVIRERIRRADSAAPCKICDGVVNGGEAGNGVYPVGTIFLPLHPRCYCSKKAVVMSGEEFEQRLRGYLAGAQSWQGMERYTRWLGMAGSGLMDGEIASEFTGAFAVWHQGNVAEKRAALGIGGAGKD
jgi:hypothetical protein